MRRLNWVNAHCLVKFPNGLKQFHLIVHHNCDSKVYCTMKMVGTMFYTHVYGSQNFNDFSRLKNKWNKDSFFCVDTFELFCFIWLVFVFIFIKLCTEVFCKVMELKMSKHKFDFSQSVFTDWIHSNTIKSNWRGLTFKAVEFLKIKFGWKILNFDLVLMILSYNIKYRNIWYFSKIFEFFVRLEMKKWNEVKRF